MTSADLSQQTETPLCGRQPIDTDHFGPCTRAAGHQGPCAHRTLPAPSPPVDGWYTVHPDTAEIVLVLPSGGDRWRDVLKQIAQETDNGRPALDAAQSRDLAREALDEQ